MGWKQFTRERLTSEDVQNYLMDQAVLQFASAAARDAELLSPEPGMIVYLQDMDRHYRRNASNTSWQALGAKHFGARSTFPSSAEGLAVGDTVEHTGYRCLMVCTNGTGDVSKVWRQITDCLVDDRAMRMSLPTSALHDGFVIHELAGNRRYAWDGVNSCIPQGSPPQDSESAAIGTVWTAGASWTLSSFVLQEMGQGFAMLNLTVTRASSAVPVSAIGDLANTTVATLKAGYTKWAPLILTPLASGDGSRDAHGYFHPDGSVVLSTVGPGASIAIGDAIQLSGLFRLATPTAFG